MSYLLFLDESGHDHKNMPYEIHGGIVLDVKNLWPFVKAVAALERDVFGCHLHEYKSEIIGSKLLDKDRVKWANQMNSLPDEERRKGCLGFLNKGLNKGTNKSIPTKIEFSAYGQACLLMVQNILNLLKLTRVITVRNYF